MRQRIEGVQVDRRADQQRRPQQHLDDRGEDRRRRSRSPSPSSTTPKKFFTVCIQAPARGISAPADTPTASSGTPMPSAIANSAAAAQHRIARLVDVQQRAGQRRRHARADDQRRQHAHGEHAPERAALHAIARAGQAALQRRGKLQLVEAEHRQRKRDEQRREAAEHPWVLQGPGQQRPRQPRRDPASGVGDRHPEHVHRATAGGVRSADPLALADDDPGQDRNHRQHAGREGQQQAEAEEAGDHAPEAAPRRICATCELSSTGAAAPAGGSGGGSRRFRCRRLRGGQRARQRGRRSGAACAAGIVGGQHHIEVLALGRIAQAGFGAALVARFHADALLAACWRSSATRPRTGVWNTSVSPKLGSFLQLAARHAERLDCNPRARRPALNPILSRYR